MKLYISLDVESDGPAPGLYSMVSFGAVVVDDALDNAFFGQTRPISNNWQPDALAISGITREDHETYPDPSDTMCKFKKWLLELGTQRLICISDNPAFDWQFINYYLHKYTGDNPLGFSARRIGDIYCGLQKDLYARWRHLRDTPHTHNPVEDAKGNAEAFLKILKELNNGTTK